VDDRRIDNRAGGDADTLARQIQVHRIQHLAAEFVCFQQMAEVQNRGLVRHRRKPSFHPVEPTGRGRREVQVETRPFHQPVADQLRLVRAVVVQDQVNVQFRRHALFDGIEKPAKL